MRVHKPLKPLYSFSNFDMKDIIIRGAREHNLKNVSLTLPRDKFIVITGLSGSGKSTLAFDTLYAEGQRRYVESLSAYARQFLGLMNNPYVDSIEGLSPAISIEQKTTSGTHRISVQRNNVRRKAHSKSAQTTSVQRNKVDATAKSRHQEIPRTTEPTAKARRERTRDEEQTA